MITIRHRTTLHVHNSIQHDSTRYNSTRHNSTHHNSTRVTLHDHNSKHHNSTRPQIDTPQLHMAVGLKQPYLRTMVSFVSLLFYCRIVIAFTLGSYRSLLYSIHLTAMWSVYIELRPCRVAVCRVVVV